MTIVGATLAFSAGVFVCISLSDLLPELEFHAHDRVKLSLALLLGVAAAYGIGYLEPEDAHESHAEPASVHQEQQNK
jgi:zinc and cadmium transporter